MLRDLRDMFTVYRAWEQAHQVPHLNNNAGQFFDVLRRYSEPHRHYHTLAHIAACLRFLDRTYPAPISGEVNENSLWWDHRMCLQLAIIYHDIIYDVKSKTNELDSAAHARIQMGVMGFNRDHIAVVSRLIMLTANHKGDPADVIGSIMIDTDMHVFAEPDAIYAKYAADIRKEYEPAFGREPFLTGRRYFLSTVDPENIFVTPEMDTDAVRSQAAWNIAEENRKLV